MRTTETPARYERRVLCDLLEERGPDAPALPEGWRAAEVAAHLWVRERRPDAGPGLVLGGPAKRWTDRVMAQTLASRGFARVVREVREGPPALSVFALPGVEERANVTEFFVHAEDVRRGDGTRTPRALPEDLDRALWHSATRVAPVMLGRRARGLGVELATPAGAGGGEQGEVVRVGTPVVRLRGEPGELVLWLFGRREAAQVELVGPPEAVARLRG